MRGTLTYLTNQKTVGQRHRRAKKIKYTWVDKRSPKQICMFVYICICINFDRKCLSVVYIEPKLEYTLQPSKQYQSYI